jgi:hypothetical protein
MLTQIGRACLPIALAGGVLAQTPSSSNPRLSASVLALVTRATPTAGGRSLTEAYFAQPMVSAAWLSSNAFAIAALDLECVTMRRGELTTGMNGEGYVDRRHPHTYLHELVVGASATLGRAALSVTAGKGFVPFGSDDPMLRPTVNYPINHHLAQILERAVVIGGARYSHALLEAAVFNGDEPTEPASSPRLANFGDSWATRLILGHGAFQLSGSYAFLRSPENPDRQSLDQRKHHASARWSRSAGATRMAAMVEWAKSIEGNPGGSGGFSFSSLLAEGEWWSGRWGGALRLERTERPEEERTLEDPFRTVRPAIDNSLLGITRWDVFTLTAFRQVTWPRVRMVVFSEASLSHPASTAPSAFQPLTHYGSDRLWLVSAGARLAIGAIHEGMGYYGVRRRSQTTNHRHH